jgi:hypothetical protein
MDKPLDPIAVEFSGAGKVIAEALTALGFEVGSCRADWLLPDSPSERRFIAVPVGDVEAGTILVAALAERLNETGHGELAQSLGPFAAVILQSRVLVVFLGYPGDAAAITMH